MIITGLIYIKDKHRDYMTVYKSHQALRLHCGEVEGKDIREVELEIKDE